MFSTYQLYSSKKSLHRSYINCSLVYRRADNSEILNSHFSLFLLLSYSMAHSPCPMIDGKSFVLASLNCLGKVTDMHMPHMSLCLRKFNEVKTELHIMVIQ